MDGKIYGLQRLVSFLAAAKRRLKPGQRVVLEHTPESHSEVYLNKSGEPVIMSVDKCTFTFNRNLK